MAYSSGYHEIMGQTRSTGARYNGLRNQGATCYLNSVLQCLYMTEDFRKEVENFTPDSSNIHMEATQSNELMLELKDLFKKIKEADGTTNRITQSLGIRNVREQQDAVEYYQKILKAANPQASKIFEGVMSNNTTCLNNHTFHEKHHFFTIPLPIEVGHSDVVSGLQTFFKSVKLDEDNWLYCKDCRKKTETVTWTGIEVFPTILTLYLKRFYYDYNQMKAVKNHCSMNILPKLEINNIGYSLYAVINHSGDESGGHYNVLIKSFEDGEWYLFDDSSVTKVSGDLFLHCSKTAFLLMYRKLNTLHSDEKEPCCAPKPNKLVKVKGEEHLSCVVSLKEDWKVVSDQVHLRQQNLEELETQMQAYRQLYDWLILWIADAKKQQKKIQARPVSDKKALKKQLPQAKKLLEEIKNKEDKVKQCKNYAFDYVKLIKDHELQLVTLKTVFGFFDNKVVASSNSIIKEITNLEKLYTEVLTLTHQYIHLKMDNYQEDNEKEMPVPLSNEEIKHKHQEVQGAPQTSPQNNIEEKWMIQSQMETTIKQEIVVGAEQDTAEEEDSLRKVVQIATEKHDNKTNKKCEAKEMLKQKSETEQEAVMQTHKAKEVCETFKQQAEEDKTQRLAEDAIEVKESTKTYQTNVQQNADETEHQNQAEASRHAQAQEHTEKLRNMPKTEGKQMVHLANDVAMQGRFNRITTESEIGNATEFIDPTPEPTSFHDQTVKKYKFDKEKTILVEGLRKYVTLEQLRDSQIIDQKVYTKLINGSISVEDISEDLKKYLHGTNSIAGIYVVDTKERLSFYQAMKRNLIAEDLAIELLRAQAATGYMIDPSKNQKLTVNDAVEKKVVGSELKYMLLPAEQAVTGYTDTYTDMVYSLFQAMKSCLIDENIGIYLLEAQIATGGIIDPKASHRLPVKVACQQGLLDDEMYNIRINAKTKRFCFYQSVSESLTYTQLLERCTIDAETGLALLLL